MFSLQMPLHEETTGGSCCVEEDGNGGPSVALELIVKTRDGREEVDNPLCHEGVNDSGFGRFKTEVREEFVSGDGDIASLHTVVVVSLKPSCCPNSGLKSLLEVLLSDW